MTFEDLFGFSILIGLVLYGLAEFVRWFFGRQ
jgi:hypothetical protein